ncbi:MAG: glycosyl hydrolase [Chloroflexota bacterium]
MIRRLPAIAAILALLCVVPLRPAPVAHASTSPLMLGAFLNDTAGNMVFDATTSDPTSLDRYASLVGRMPAIVMWYQGWGNNHFQTTMAAAVTARNAIPMITWQPAVGAADPSAYSCRAVASGKYDAYMRAWAQGAAAWGHPFLLRFGHEMNGNWYPWGTGPGNANGNTPADFIAEWRHVHDLFASVGATNALWVWSPNVANGPTDSPFASDYPGDNYVDWVALDGYNFYSVKPHTPYLSLAQIYSTSYAAITALTTKPLIIGETATLEAGGSKAQWVSQAFLTDIPTLFPQIRGVVWFDMKQETDWRVNSSSTSLSAYQQVVASSEWQGTFSSTGAGPAAPFSASYAVRGQRSTFITGETDSYQVTLTNAGTSAWPAGGPNPVHLRIAFGAPGSTGLPGSTLYTDQGFALPADVAPGQSVTLNVAVSPPGAGTYALIYQAVQEGVAFFPQYHDSAVSVGTLGARYAPISQPVSWAKGASQTYQVSVTNTGSATWVEGGTYPIHLRIAFAAPSSTTIAGGTLYTDQGFALPSNVAPGQSVTLTVSVTAPATTGNYALIYEAVQEGIQFFPQYLDNRVSVT